MNVRKTVAVLTGLALTAPMAFADTPTTASQLAQSVDMSDAKAAGLIITGLLVSAGVVLWGARLVASKFKPKV
jgi:di/tricarboxylate transporter